MDEIISYKMCAVKVRNAKLRNYLKWTVLQLSGLIKLFAHATFQTFNWQCAKMRPTLLFYSI